MIEEIRIEGINIALRRTARARRMTLRVSRAGGGVVMTLPPHASVRQAERFARDRADWLVRTVSAAPAAQSVAEGVRLPVAGHAVEIRCLPLKAVRVEGDVLYAPQGRAVGPTVQAYLKHRALLALREAVDRHAARLGRAPTALTLRDTRSRWGSCTHDGRLMFSWRLAMAPPEVLDYVAAHEVAHLAHMDHSARFWAEVARLLPDYATPRAWLRQNGASLQLWRFRD